MGRALLPEKVCHHIDSGGIKIMEVAAGGPMMTTRRVCG